VVEDEPIIAMEIEFTLSDAGFQVVGPVMSVAVALECIHAEPPHAAVLDVSLRGERVTPVAEMLRLLNVPYVLTSAYQASDLAGEPALAQARNLGKPTPSIELVRVLQDLVHTATP
jgi:DNA-binding response OmpR family regulator